MDQLALRDHRQRITKKAQTALLPSQDCGPQFLLQFFDRKGLADRGRSSELLLKQTPAVTRAEQERNPSSAQDAGYREDKLSSQVRINERHIKRCARG